eukprot:261011-Pleurochrysis_carterae.AAC.1
MATMESTTMEVVVSAPHRPQFRRDFEARSVCRLECTPSGRFEPDNVEMSFKGANLRAANLNYVIATPAHAFQHLQKGCIIAILDPVKQPTLSEVVVSLPGSRLFLPVLLFRSKTPNALPTLPRVFCLVPSIDCSHFSHGARSLNSSHTPRILA